MRQNFRIEGIYDQRTLKHLKQIGLKNFSFDFSPKSFNFVQEYVFLEQLINLLDPSDKVFLHFSRSNDPMINKLIGDLKKLGFNLSNVFFEFEEWSTEMTPINFDYNYLVKFSKDTDASKMIGKKFKGFIFDFNFFEDLHQNNLINTFANNFFTRFAAKMNDESFMLLRADWHNNIFNSLFDLFEFDLVSFPINSKIEVCYRNVDLKKLSFEMELLSKSTSVF